MSLQSRLENTLPVEEADGLIRLLEEEKEGTLIQCLDDGFIRLVDYMASDADVVQAARTSYGKGTKTVSDDRGLIRYLMRHWHTTPFEMCEFKFHVRVPMDCWRQWVRHRMASINETSTRYSEAIDSAQTALGEWRSQSKDNKQGSFGLISDQWPDDEKFLSEIGKYDGAMFKEMTPAEWLSQEEEMFHEQARELYEHRLKLGVAREQARKDLPLSTYTEAYWKIDLHNLFHFLRLRMDGHAQLEIRTYAEAIGELIEPIVPACWEAFADYRLNAMQLSALDIQVMRAYMLGESDWYDQATQVMSKREREELFGKAAKFGMKFDRTSQPSSQPA
jgi:thymidylate synthase (FAD)